MTDFTFFTNDPARLAGITAAREVYNASLPVPPEPIEGEDPPEPDPDAPQPIETDADYVQFVMMGATASYAVQYGTGTPE